MKVLVTGAAGNLGSFATKELVNAGYQVTATDRRDHADLPVKVAVCDLLDGPAVSKLCAGVEAIVHLGNIPGAGWTKEQHARIFNENTAMTMNVLQAALEVGVRKIVYASSIQAMASVWCDTQPDQQPYKVAYLPLDGDCPAHPTNTYALSKAVGELMLRDFVARPGMECVALRFPGMFREKPHAKPGLPQARPSPCIVAQGFSFLSFADAARLIHAILKSTLPGFRVYLPALSRGAGALVPQFIERFYPGVPLRVPVSQMTSLIDLSRITRETDWTPQDVPAE
jgi:nucleoside-diphosphate-sugar epimerase